MLRLLTLRGSRVPAIPNSRSSLTELPLRGLSAPAPWRRAAVRSASTKNEQPGVEKNKHGEIIVWRHIQKHPPQGYSFVRAGKPFVARRSRELSSEAQKAVYVLMRRRKKNLKLREGYFVPTHVLNQAEAQSAKRKEHDRALTQERLAAEEAAEEAASKSQGEETKETTSQQE